MNLALLNQEIQSFINANLDSSITNLALQKNPFPDIEWLEILNQISGKQKSKTKLPTFFNTQNIYYPSKISLEQTSSEKTAIYKASLVSGKNLIDATGGFGIDDYYFSKRIEQVVHCEINSELHDIVKHNFNVLQQTNTRCYLGDSTEILKKINLPFDWIYIDPSRRNEVKGKVFMLKDCLPNVPDLLDFYFEYSDKILIKTAPILDISAGILELNNVKTIHIVAVDNEVKELLWEIKKDFIAQIQIKTCNITKDKIDEFEFILNDTFKDINYSIPQKYLYEPNSAIMKSGGFDAIAKQYNLSKLHQNSHLYTANNIIDFPGRIFEIQQNIPYQKKEMKLNLENTKANITTRNFPDSVETIRKKWKIKDGGNQYCFFTTDVNNNKIVLICTKIK